MAHSLDSDVTSVPMPNGPIAGPAAWYGKEMEASTEWVYVLSQAEISEL